MNHHEMIAQLSKMLRNLDRWIEKATVFAETKKFDVNTLANARLAPDMYPFVKQVQSSCDSAKFTAAYLSGKEAPAHPDTETTMAECRARIASCLGWLESLKLEDFANASTRKISPKWLQGKHMMADHYVFQVGIPNFYFHVTTAYDILRHNGVELGKMDYMGTLPIKD